MVPLQAIVLEAVIVAGTATTGARIERMTGTQGRLWP
jgi:hypothetical protein